MKRCFLLFCMMIAFVVVLTACSSSATPTTIDAPKTPQDLQPTPISDALFQVIKLDGSIQGFTWDDLKKLPLVQVTVEGKVEEGPKLLDVLNAVGNTEFSEVTLTGITSPVTLTREQVNDNTILDFTNHGTVKLATTYVAKPDWTKDITEITVK